MGWRRASFTLTAQTWKAERRVRGWVGGLLHSVPVAEPPDHLGQSQHALHFSRLLGAGRVLTDRSLMPRPGCGPLSLGPRELRGMDPFSSPISLSGYCHTWGQRGCGHWMGAAPETLGGTRVSPGLSHTPSPWKTPVFGLHWNAARLTHCIVLFCRIVADTWIIKHL